MSQPLHQQQRGLPVMDAVAQHGRSGGDLGLVDRLRQGLAAGLDQRRPDLARHALEFWIWHDQRQVGPTEIGKAGDVGRVAGGHHDGQIVGGERDYRAGQPAVLHPGLAGALFRHHDVRLCGEGEVAGGDGAASLQLLQQQAGWQGLVEYAASIRG